MNYRNLLIFFLIAWTMPLHADEPSLGPLIEEYGPTFPITDRDVPLAKGFVYRAVFDVGAHRGEVGDVNARLVSVARYLNMHARNGVPAKNMDLAMVVHGSALKNLLANDNYWAHYGFDNPNLDLIEKLHDAGVKIYVCGQSMAFNGVGKDELIDAASVALSAMTMLTVLQSDGYALLP